MSDQSFVSKYARLQQPSDWRGWLRKNPTTARRASVFVFCILIVYAMWVLLRWQSIPGSDKPLWSLPLATKGSVLIWATLGLYGLFRLGGFFLRAARTLYRNPSQVRSSGVRVTWYRYLNPIGLFYNLYEHRNLLQQTVQREVRQRYQGSFLGILWSLATPLLTLIIYTFVFSVILKARFGDSDSPLEYGLTLFAGLIAFNLFSETVAHAPMTIVAKRNFVKRVVFPLEILPVVIMGSGLVNALISLFVLIAGLWLMLGSVSSTFMLVLLMMLPLIGYALGLSWFLSSLGVFVRDLNPIMLVAIRMLFYLSAVFYPITRVPEEVQHVLQLNPLVGIIDNFRRVVMWNEMPDWTSWAGVTAISFVVMLLGYTWFMKTKRAFADVL